MSKSRESGAKNKELSGDVNGQASEAARDKQTSSATSPALAPEVERHIEERITSEVERRFQSAKDKRWTQLEKQYGALSEFQNALENAGAVRAPAQGGWLSKKVESLLEMSGLDNDPEVSEFLGSKAYSEDTEGYVELLGDLTELVLQRKQRGPASAGTVTQPSGGSIPQSSLREDYEIRLSKLPPGDVNALTALKREFRAKGLDVF